MFHQLFSCGVMTVGTTTRYEFVQYPVAAYNSALKKQNESLATIPSTRSPIEIHISSGFLLAGYATYV